MATFTATPAETRKPAKSSGWAGAKQVAIGTYDVGTILAAADVIKFCKLPRGAVVVGGRLFGDPLASGTFASQCLTLNIGVDASVVTAIGTAVTTLSTSTALGSSLAPNSDAVSGVGTGETIITMPLGGLLCTHGPFRLEADGTVYATIVTSAGAGSWLSGTLSIAVDYFVEQHA